MEVLEIEEQICIVVLKIIDTEILFAIGIILPTKLALQANSKNQFNNS